MLIVVNWQRIDSRLSTPSKSGMCTMLDVHVSHGEFQIVPVLGTCTFQYPWLPSSVKIQKYPQGNCLCVHLRPIHYSDIDCYGDCRFITRDIAQGQHQPLFGSVPLTRTQSMSLYFACIHDQSSKSIFHICILWVENQNELFNWMNALRRISHTVRSLWHNVSISAFYSRWSISDTWAINLW